MKKMLRGDNYVNIPEGRTKRRLYASPFGEHNKSACTGLIVHNTKQYGDIVA